MTPSRKILIIAGPNGAGKTTFATEFLPNEADCPVFLNADLIAAGLSPFRPSAVDFRAGRLMLDEIHRYAAGGESFAFETTLSGRGHARAIPRWRERGYRVKLFFLRLPAPEMAIERVRLRVSEGGHDVPEAVVRRRFRAGWRNFERVYRDLVDAWVIHDNSGTTPVLVEEGNEPMKSRRFNAPKPTEPSRDPDIAGSEAAMRRAAARARRRAAEHGRGAVAVFEDGKVVRVKVDGEGSLMIGMDPMPVAVTIRNPVDPGWSWEGRFLAGTGATDTLVPGLRLEAIGLSPKGRRVYEQADGSETTMDITTGEIEFAGETVGGTILYGAADAEPLLGATALESAGVRIDPINRELKRLPAVRLKESKVRAR